MPPMQQAMCDTCIATMLPIFHFILLQLSFPGTLSELLQALADTILCFQKHTIRRHQQAMSCMAQATDNDCTISCDLMHSGSPQWEV